MSRRWMPASSTFLRSQSLNVLPLYLKHGVLGKRGYRFCPRLRKYFGRNDLVFNLVDRDADVMALDFCW